MRYSCCVSYGAFRIGRRALQSPMLCREGASPPMKGRILALAAPLIAMALSGASVSGASVDPVIVDPTSPGAAPSLGAPPADPFPADPPLVDIQLPSAPAGAASPQAAPEEIIVRAKRRAIAADPLENLNETSYEVIQSVDKAIVGPVAIAYRDKIPNPLRVGIRNFLSNIGEPIMFVNFLLQIKPGKAAETMGRFAINSTLGIAGVMDVAKKKPFHLPHRVNGFAYTMGYYGIRSGPYLYLPFIGPTTLRDVTGRMMDLMLLPVAVGPPLNNPFYALPAGILSSLDDRAEFDAELTRLRTQSGDPYAALRAYYLNKRQAEIDALRGKSSPPPIAAPIPAPIQNPPQTQP